jgi:hypothetical protein
MAKPLRIFAVTGEHEVEIPAFKGLVPVITPFYARPIVCDIY